MIVHSSLQVESPPGGWIRWLDAVYGRLLHHFGFRRWWPAATNFEMVVGAYLTQNCAWRNVEQALANLRRKGLLTAWKMAKAPVAQLEACIRPAGYFRQKTARLQTFLAHMQRGYTGGLPQLLARPWPELRAELLALPGVGPETADSILCYAAEAPVMVMDAYTRRIFHRLGAFRDPEVRYEAMQAFFHQLGWDAGRYGDFHAQIVALGKDYCTKRTPRCPACPLADLCRRQGVAGAAAPTETGPESTPMALPVRVVYRNQKNSSGRLRGGEIVLHISSRLPRKAQEEHMRVLVQRLEPRRASAPPAGLTPCIVTNDAALAAWAHELNQRHFGFELGQVRFKQQVGRWGSCSWRTGTIYISSRLRGGPKELLEYVLVHELAHLKRIQPAHGPAFWRLVGTALPDYDQRRRLLRDYERWLESGTAGADAPEGRFTR